MTFAKLTPAHIHGLLYARILDECDAREIRKDVWRSAKNTYGIPHTDKIKAAIDDPTSDDYGVIKNKNTGLPYFEKGSEND